MGLPVHFDHEPGRGAVEIDDAAPDGMLPPELEPVWPPTKLLPQHTFWQRHLAPESSGFQDRFIFLPA